jgi:hypothetical protein
MRITTALAAALAAFASGCGDDGPKLVPVSGVVTLNGKPLEGATISFVPDSSNKEGLPGEDITGPQGNYKAMTRGRSGLVPGKYKAVVTKVPSAPAGAVAANHPDDPFMAELSVAGPEAAKGKKKGSAGDKLDWEKACEVPPNGGSLDFDVKATAAAGAADEKK